MAVRFDRSKLNAIAKAKKLFVSETHFRFCAIDLQISLLALVIVSKKIIQNRQWNLRKVVPIWRSSETQGLPFIYKYKTFTPLMKPHII